MGQDRRAHIESRALRPQEALLLRIFGQSERLTILDAGACEGEDSVRYARLFPRARIYAVEPLPGNLAMIAKNVAEYGTPNVAPVEGCLSDVDGEAEFHVSSGSPREERVADQDWDYGNKSSSLLAPYRTAEVHPWLEFREEVTVRTMRLDGLAARLGVAAIDFFHLDVQGAELMVLQGAGTLLSRIRTLWLEVEAVELYRGQPVKSDVEGFLRRAGFVRLLDAVDEVSGDQFWAQSRWLRKRKGSLWAWAERLQVARRTHHSRPSEAPTRELEARMREFYARFVSPGQLCFDIGANWGNRTRVFEALGARVLAVEPQRECARSLRATYFCNRRVKVLNVGAGAEKGTAQLLVATTSTVSSMAPDWVDAVSATGRFGDVAWVDRRTVRLTTLDALVKRYGTPRFVKIDVEGFELEVLKGLTSPVPFVSFEFTPECGATTLACIDRLSGLGLTRFNLSMGESMILAREAWLDADGIKAALAGVFEESPTVFGDVYAAFGRGV